MSNKKAAAAGRPVRYLDRAMIATACNIPQIHLQEWIDRFPIEAAVIVAASTRPRYGYTLETVHAWIVERAEAMPQVWDKYLEEFERQHPILHAWIYE